MRTVNVHIEWPADLPPLPDTARARVTVEDASMADESSRVLGETTLGHLSVDRSPSAHVAVGDVDPRADVIVRVHVSRAGEQGVAIGDLITTQSYPVLTHGHGNEVVVRPRLVGS